MTASPFRRIAIIGALAASSFVLAASSSAFGPPWISVETPPNPFDATSRGAFLVVHTYHHGETEAEPEPAPEDGLTARITLRLPDSLKTSVEGAAAKEGVSVNTWIVKALGRGLTSVVASGGRVGSRLTGYGQS